MLHAILLASLISLFAIAEVSAQTAPASHDGFKDFTPGRTVSVFDGTGYQSTGRLLLATPDTLTVDVNGRDVVFDRKNVATVYERGNSIKKGLFAGVALAVAAAASGAPSAEAAGGELIFGVLAIGGGIAIDAAIPGKRLLYANPANYERGDSNKNGLILGLLAGSVAGFAAGATKDDCDHTPTVGPKYFTPLDCTADEKIANGGKVAAVTGLAGAGIGVLIDRMIVGERLVYRASLSPSRLSLTTSVSW